jgi:hypothetical protein
VKTTVAIAFFFVSLFAACAVTPAPPRPFEPSIGPIYCCRGGLICKAGSTDKAGDLLPTAFYVNAHCQANPGHCSCP